MPKLKPATQRARREHILDAAEVCFARAGFHRTTMQDICKEALISPGALYVYFNSKEDLIAGLAERDRSDFAERFADLSEAADLMQSLSQLGNHYFVDEPAHKRTMCLEIGLEVHAQSEGRRDLSLGRSLRSRQLREAVRRAAAEGRIAPDVDIPTLTKLFSVIGDGMFMRRALDPNFDTEALVPAVMALIGKLLNVTAGSASRTRRQSRGEASMKRFFLTLVVLAAIGAAGIFLGPARGAGARPLPGRRQRMPSAAAPT